MGMHDRGGDYFAGFCGVAVAFFDFFQSLIAKFEARFIFGEPLRHASVKVPAKVVEFRRGGESFHFGQRFLFEMEEAEDYVCHLDAGIVDVILDFDTAAGVTEQPCESVAQDCVANVSDMRRFVWIDASVLDDSFWSVRNGRRGFVPGFFASGAKKLGAVEKKIYVPPTSHIEVRNSLDRFQRIGNLLRQRSRRLSRLLS